MNDSKNSSNGLLVISTPNPITPEELLKLRQQIDPLAAQMDLTSISVADGTELSAVIDYRPLLARLCVAVERLVAQGEPPAVPEEIAPPALNARHTGLNSRG